MKATLIRKGFLYLIIVFLSGNLISQELDSMILNQVESIGKFYYEIGKDLSETKQLFFTASSITFPWEENNSLSFDTVRITKDDIGEIIYLNEKKYSIIDIHQNCMIIKPFIFDKDEFYNLEFFNISDSDSVYKLTPGSEISTDKLSAGYVDHYEGKYTIRAEIYGIFRNNPSISFEEFMAEVWEDLVQISASEYPKEESEKLLGQRLIVLYSAAPVNNIILYTQRDN